MKLASREQESESTIKTALRQDCIIEFVCEVFEAASKAAVYITHRDMTGMTRRFIPAQREPETQGRPELATKPSMMKYGGSRYRRSRKFEDKIGGECRRSNLRCVLWYCISGVRPVEGIIEVSSSDQESS